MADNTNPAEAGSDDAELFSVEDAVKYLADEDFPEAESNPEPKAEKATDGKTTDDASQEQGENPEEPQAEENPQEEQKPEASDDVLVKLDDGKTVPVAELKALAKQVPELESLMTRKTQEVASERRELQTLGTNMASVLQNVIGFVESMLPPEPDQALMWTDPPRHYQQTQLRNQAMAQFTKLFDVKAATDGAIAQLSEADFRAAKQQANEELQRINPSLKDPKRLETFERRIEAHAKSLGFTDDQIKSTVDPKIRQMVWESAQYREITAKAAQAKTKIEGAPTLKAPPPKSQQHPNSTKALANVNALKRLQKTGSLYDAMNIDFV